MREIIQGLKDFGLYPRSNDIKVFYYQRGTRPHLCFKEITMSAWSRTNWREINLNAERLLRRGYNNSTGKT